MSSRFDLASLLTPAALLSALAGAPACSSGDVPIGENGTSARSTSEASDSGAGASDAGEPSECATDSDCTGGYLCGYPVQDRCSASGTCFAPPPAGVESCGVLMSNCACDGTNVYTGCTKLPDGYASKPVAKVEEECGQVDGGSSPLPSSCHTDADCSNGTLCGYKETEACGATGTCLSSTGALCNSALPACACDGTTINSICGGLPDGYTSKPVVYPIESACPAK